MADAGKRYFKPATIALMACMFALCPGVQTASALPARNRDALVNTAAPPSQDVVNILTTLERKVGDRQRMLEKAKEKLAGLSEKDVRLIASLCERIRAEGGTAESDIAFLLAAALVILS